jgi:hypothetical protein
MTVTANNELQEKTVADVITEVRERCANMGSLTTANIDEKMQAFIAENN